MAPVPGVERRLADQSMHAGFRAQPAIGIVALDMYGRTLDAGHNARRCLDEVRAKSVYLCPAQIHAQKHLREVLRFGTAGPRLDVEIGVAGIHVAGEHAAKLEAGHEPFAASDISRQFVHRRGIAFFYGQFEKLRRIAERAVQIVQAANDLLQPRTLLCQSLGPARIVPDLGLFQFPLYLGQALTLVLVVKDTPSTPLRVGEGPKWPARSDSFPSAVPTRNAACPQRA